jgi:hypothetical protein
METPESAEVRRYVKLLDLLAAMNEAVDTDTVVEHDGWLLLPMSWIDRAIRLRRSDGKRLVVFGRGSGR